MEGKGNDKWEENRRCMDKGGDDERNKTQVKTLRKWKGEILNPLSYIGFGYEIVVRGVNSRFWNI